MEHEQGFSVVLTKITKWVGIVVLVLILLTWALMYATFSANYAWVYPVRKLYHERVLEPRSLPDKLPYSVQVKAVGEGGYTYELIGRIVGLDYTRYMMTIEDKRGDRWDVRMIHAPYHEANKIEIAMSEIGVDRVTKKMTIVPVNLVIDRRKPEATEEYLHEGEVMDIVWRDSLTLAEIVKNNREGKYTVMLAGDIVKPLGKVVGK